MKKWGIVVPVTVADDGYMDAMAEGSSMAEAVNEDDIQEGVAMASGSVGNSPEPQQAMDTHGKPRTPTHSHPRQTPMAEPQQAMEGAMAEPQQSEPQQPTGTHGNPRTSMATYGHLPKCNTTKNSLKKEQPKAHANAHRSLIKRDMYIVHCMIHTSIRDSTRSSRQTEHDRDCARRWVMSRQLML